MAIEIRRFGVGHRWRDIQGETHGVSGEILQQDARGLVVELAFAREALLDRHANPNTTLFIVIEGGGWVRVGDESVRVAAGDAVTWPANIAHAATTELSEMRALIVEFAGADDSAVRVLGDGRVQPRETTDDEWRFDIPAPARATADEAEGEPV